MALNLKERKFILCLIVVVLLLTLSGCNRQSVLNDVQVANEEKTSIIKNDKHENITLDLIELVENELYTVGYCVNGLYAL